MARPLRVQFPGAVYHLTSRGNARQAIYLGDDDRQRFCLLLAQVISRYAWRCHAFCLMTNHYHLLIETLRPTLVAGCARRNTASQNAVTEPFDPQSSMYDCKTCNIVDHTCLRTG